MRRSSIPCVTITYLWPRCVWMNCGQYLGWVKDNLPHGELLRSVRYILTEMVIIGQHFCSWKFTWYRVVTNCCVFEINTARKTTQRAAHYILNEKSWINLCKHVAYVIFLHSLYPILLWHIFRFHIFSKICKV